MPEAKVNNPEEKNISAFVLRVGSHPAAYSVTAILAIGAVVFFLAIVPLTRMLQPGGSASVSDAQSQNEAAKAKLESQKKVVNAIAKIDEDQRKLIAYALPDEADTPGLAIQINSLVSQSGLKMTSIDMTAASGDSDSLSGQSLAALNVVIAVEGITYENLKVILSNIEKNLRPLDVRTLNFSPSTGGTTSITLEMKTYYVNGT